MSEKAKNCLERIGAVVQTLPEDAAEAILRDAAARVEGVADYLAYLQTAREEGNT